MASAIMANDRIVVRGARERPRLQLLALPHLSLQEMTASAVGWMFSLGAAPANTALIASTRSMELCLVPPRQLLLAY